MARSDRVVLRSRSAISGYFSRAARLHGRLTLFRSRIDKDVGVTQRSAEGLRSGLADIARSPQGCGTLELIVCRPGVDEREILEQGRLDADLGLIGDNWKVRGSSSMPDRSANPNAQVTLMNS